MKKNNVTATIATKTLTYEFEGKTIAALYNAETNELIGRFDAETEGYMLSYWAGDNWNEF